MRLAYLCSRYPALSHTFVLREVRALRDRGVSVTTFTIRRSPPEEVLGHVDAEEAASTYSVLPARATTLIRAHLRSIRTAARAYVSTLALALRIAGAAPRGLIWAFFYFAESVIVWDECVRRGVDHVHVHFANVAADVALLATHFGAATGVGPPTWSFTLHGPTELQDVAGHHLSEKIRRAQFVACISDYARSQAMTCVADTDWEKLHVLHCGIDTRAFSCERPPENSASDSVAVLSVGRLEARKGHALLLDAVARLVDAGIDVRLKLAGGGEERSALEARAARLRVGDRVAFLGAVSQDEIQGLYAAADVFCLPSFSEGVPVVLMEAMAMRLPVVATLVAGIPELVEDGVSGLLVAPGRADELARALADLAGSPERRRRMGDAGRAQVMQGWELRRSAERLQELFEATVGG